MAGEISKGYNFLTDFYNAEELVNTVTKVRRAEINLDWQTNYPLVNIDYVGTTLVGTGFALAYIVTIVQQRDLYTELVKDDNYEDNLNETFYLANRLVNNLRNQRNDYNVFFGGVSSISNINKSIHLDGLDGHEFTITLLMGNSTEC